MAIPDLEYFAQLIREDIAGGSLKNTRVASFRKILACDWQAPQELKDLEWWADIKSSTPADGVDAAVRAFSTNMPSIRVFPSLPGDDNKARAESVEDNLLYHFRKSNQRSTYRPIERSLKDMLETGMVAAQVKYIPFHYKAELVKKKGESETEYARRTKRIRAMRAQGDFTYSFHFAEHVYPHASADMLERVTLAQPMTVAEIRREFGDENKGVKKLLKELATAKEFKGSEPEKFYCSFYQLDDYDHTVRFAIMTNSQTVDKEVGGDRIEIMREEHGLDFLPWAFRECTKPLLQTVVDSDSWFRQNELLSMHFALMKAVVAHPYIIAQTMSGEALDIDYTSPGGQVLVKTGETATPLAPRQMDPNLVQEIQMGEAKLGQQINTRALTALSDFASSTPYATVNAILQSTVSSLSDKKLAVQAFWEQVFILQLRWINYSQISLVGRRLKNRRGSEYNSLAQKGAQVSIGMDTANDVLVDPDNMYLEVRLNENLPTDRQTRLNQAIMLHREAPFALSDCLEYFGLDDIEINENSWMQERFFTAVVEAKSQTIINEANQALRDKIKMEVQAEMQAQSQQQPQQSPNPVAQEQQLVASQNIMGQGMQGGAESAMSMPGVGREQISGETQGGEAMA
jgi:hypothetical protein